MNNNVKILILTLTMLMFLGLNCKKKTTEPDDKTKLGKRNYVWNMDTIAYPNSSQTTMEDMWASSASNVYVVGWNERVFGSMYHFDGTQWQYVRLHYNEGGPIQHGFSFRGIHGTSSNNIWAVGRGGYWDIINQRIYDSSFAIHFDGSQWSEFHIVDGRELFSVWVLSENDVWMCGNSGALFHITGSGLAKYDLHEDYFMSSICALSPTEVYVVGHRHDKISPDDSSASFLFRFDGNEWKVIDSVGEIPGAAQETYGSGGVWTDGHTLYSLGEDIYIRSKNKWKKILENTQSGHMWKNSENCIFTVGISIYNYNGNDWKEYPQYHQLSNIGWFDCYANGLEVFVVGNDNSRTYILHGK